MEGMGYVISGIVLGLTAGISPGPLLALVFSETIRHGKKEGIKVALAPLITDLPIILFALIILSNLSEYDIVIGVISLAGAVYLIYLGVENLITKIDVSEGRSHKKDALKRGVVANLLNPHPYIFWFTIGGTIIHATWDIHFSITFLFILIFYSLLIGSKIAIVLVLARSRSFLRSKYYMLVVRALGVVLLIFAVMFAMEGLEMVGVL